MRHNLGLDKDGRDNIGLVYDKIKGIIKDR